MVIFFGNLKIDITNKNLLNFRNFGWNLIGKMKLRIFMQLNSYRNFYKI